MNDESNTSPVMALAADTIAKKASKVKKVPAKKTVAKKVATKAPAKKAVAKKVPAKKPAAKPNAKELTPKHKKGAKLKFTDKRTGTTVNGEIFKVNIEPTGAFLRIQYVDKTSGEISYTSRRPSEVKLVG